MKLPKREDLPKIAKGIAAGVAVSAAHFGQGAWYIGKRGWPVCIGLIAAGIGLGYGLGVSHPIGGSGIGFQFHAMLQSLGASGIAMTTGCAGIWGTMVAGFKAPAAIAAGKAVRNGASPIQAIRAALNPPPEADPATKKPSAELPPAKPAGEAPAPATGEAPAAPAGDSPAPTTAGDSPAPATAGDAPATPPAADKPATDTPPARTAANDNTPPAKDPAVDAPKGADKPTEDKPAEPAKDADKNDPPPPPPAPSRMRPPGRRF